MAEEKKKQEGANVEDALTNPKRLLSKTKQQLSVL